MFKLSHNSISLVLEKNKNYTVRSGLTGAVQSIGKKRHIIYEITGNTSSEEEEPSAALCLYPQFKEASSKTYPEQVFRDLLKKKNNSFC